MSFFKYIVEDCVATYKGQRVTKEIIDDMIRSVFDTIKLGMIKGQSVNIRGFGTFKCIDKKGRLYVEPREQREVHKGPSKYPKFIPSPKLKEALNARKKSRSR